jgi:hypothetical protein
VSARARRALAAVSLGLCLLAGACGSSSDGAGSASTDPADTTTTLSPTPDPTIGATSMRGERYCEVLLVNPRDGVVSADVYNSYPLNTCPADQWEALDPAALAAENAAVLAVLNGPRYWLMDDVRKGGDVADLPKATFGGIEMYRQASVEIGDMAAASTPYVPHAVDRRTVFTFAAGRPVYELVDPDGNVYVMQTWSQQKDPALVEADLPGLASRLSLPDGWSYRTRTLDEPLSVDTSMVAAQVLQDDLGNSFSRVTAAG